MLAVALPAALAASALPAAAEAATVELINSGGNGVVAFNGEPGEANNVRVRLSDSGIFIEDSVRIRSRDSECRTDAAGDAFCPATAEQILVFTGDGNDTIQYRAPHGGFVSGGDGNDIVFGGLRQATFGRQIQPVIYRGKDRSNDTAVDTVSYVFADRGVRVDAEPQATPPSTPGVADDGRPGIDLEHVSDDIEVIEGSNFDDSQLFGSTGSDVLRGLNGNDVIAGGEGNDLIDERGESNGADFINGGNGATDAVTYGSRTTSGVNVSLDGLRNDGASGEQDDVRPSIEQVTGTPFRDVLSGNGQANGFSALGGNDTIHGLGGDDTLHGGAGNNSLVAGAGNDVIFARNGALDNIDCGTETDTLERDADEPSGAGCERVQIGVLRLTPKTVAADAGRTAPLRLSWRHPKAWKQLGKIELRLTRGGTPVGEITIRPRGGRIVADGAVHLVRKRTRLTRKGKTVTARLALRLDESLAGQTLKAEVEATDTRGTRQLERDAATVRVAP